MSHVPGASFTVKKQWMCDYGGKTTKITPGEAVTLVEDKGSMAIIKTPNGTTTEAPYSVLALKSAPAGAPSSAPAGAPKETGCCAACAIL
mmetsp:Transcript_26790/g.46472  ORF Transcript_26790/g.46472 Transcript_26790/m.46472 type:complete len:90 (+) Transcript_26790:56-325(+)